MSRSRFPGVVFVLACLSVLAAACYPITAPISTYHSSALPTPRQEAAVATVPPPQTPTMTATAVATLTSTPTATITATATSVATYTATPTSTAAPTFTAIVTEAASPAAGTPRAAQPAAAAQMGSTVAPASTATPQGPKKVVLTEADMQRAVTSGALSQNGIDAANVQIHFANGKFSLSADRLNYGLVGVSNLAIVGKLVAKDGVLQLETDSISPGGFVGAMIPSVANQALAQFASRWYVEQVNMGEGQIELIVR